MKNHTYTRNTFSTQCLNVIYQLNRSSCQYYDLNIPQNISSVDTSNNSTYAFYSDFVRISRCRSNPHESVAIICFRTITVSSENSCVARPQQCLDENVSCCNRNTTTLPALATNYQFYTSCACHYNHQLCILALDVVVDASRDS